MNIRIKKNEDRSYNVLLEDKVLISHLSKEDADYYATAWKRSPAKLKQAAKTLKTRFNKEHERNMKRVDEWLKKAMRRNKLLENGKDLPENLVDLNYVVE